MFLLYAHSSCFLLSSYCQMFFKKFIKRASVVAEPTHVEAALSGFANSLTLPSNLRDAAAFALVTTQVFLSKVLSQGQYSNSNDQIQAMTREKAILKQLGRDTASIACSVCLLQGEMTKDDLPPDVLQNILLFKMYVTDICRSCSPDIN